ncbi:hypothetical protein I4U23_024145 [Adineta vaga]|nr:hypothetical protein I4U23_024145 [Adineta vaga]
MSKGSKLEDYWRDHQIESLLKELTQLLTRRMPNDPAVAIVEYLQKKFPKSFKTSTNNIGVVPKPLANSLQLNTLTTPYSDFQNESTSDTQLGRQLSNQSFGSGIVTMPTMGSAFTDLLKNDTSNLSQAPEISMRNLIRASRLTQQAVKFGKNIRSDVDILEEEVFRPIKRSSTAASTAADDHSRYDPNSASMQEVQTHDQPTVHQIIKYKQHIRTENDRRIHREELAKLAKQQREKEEFFQSDLSAKPEEIQQQQQEQQMDEDDSMVSKKAHHTKASHKPTVKSKEEEEILNDENIFQPRKQRNRERQRTKVVTARTNVSDLRSQAMRDFRSTMKREDGNLICKVCGNVITDDNNQLIVDSKANSAASTSRSYAPQQSNRSVESSSAAVDDWFESSTSTSASRQSTPRITDDPTLLSIGSTTFRRNLFQPIKDDNLDGVQHQLPVRASLLTNDNTKMDRLTSPRISESGIFARSPEPKGRRPSSSRSITSPVTKKHQPETTTTVTSPQLTKTIAQPSPPRPPSATTTGRRMSGWGVREYSPDKSDEN